MANRTINFTKMTGAGNDFVVVDDRTNSIKNPSRFAKKVCDRRWGVGADGLILLRNHPNAAYEMKYYNSDGSYGGMCGNGGRCIAFFAIEKKIAPKSHDFISVNHLYHATYRAKNTIALYMKEPTRIRLNQTLNLPELNKTIEYHFIDTGAPHVVINIDEFFPNKLHNIDITTIGKLIRYHKTFQPAGTNVNIIEKQRTKISIRTYERGVEDETLACGTGSVAGALIAHLLWNIPKPIKVIPKSKKELQVSFDSEKGKIQNVVLVGPAEIVFEGQVLL